MGSAVYSAKAAAAQAAAITVPKLDNRITEGGKAETLVDHPSMAVYASDAAAIRNNIYQLAEHVKRLEAALKAAGITL